MFDSSRVIHAAVSVVIGLPRIVSSLLVLFNFESGSVAHVELQTVVVVEVVKVSLRWGPDIGREVTLWSKVDWLIFRATLLIDANLRLWFLNIAFSLVVVYLLSLHRLLIINLPMATLLILSAR